jgi:hypothetical protein
VEFPERQTPSDLFVPCAQSVLPPQSPESGISPLITGETDDDETVLAALEIVGNGCRPRTLRHERLATLCAVRAIRVK